MKKFIKGSIVLAETVKDVDKYFKEHEPFLDEIITWANSFSAAVRFGFSDNDDFLCEYKFVCSTAQMCKGMVSELKDLLKKYWKKTQLGYQISGNQLY